MKRTHFFRLIYIGLLIILIAGACVREGEYPDGELTSVNIMFGTRNATELTTVQPGEGIRTLRVLIVNPNKGNEVVVNGKFINVSEDASVTQQTFTMYDIPADIPLDYYLIANEESIDGLEAWINKNYVVDNGCNTAKLQAKVTEGAPMSGVVDGVLSYDDWSGKPAFPITCYKKKIIVNKDNNNIKFDIVRSAVKLVFTVVNNSNQEVDLEQISLSSIFPNKSYLFQQETLSTPVGTMIDDLKLNFSTTKIAASASTELSKALYMFESKQQSYLIGVNINGQDYEQKELTIDNRVIVPMRNTQFNVKLCITPTVDLEISYDVCEWVNKVVNIPPFN